MKLMCFKEKGSTTKENTAFYKYREKSGTQNFNKPLVAKIIISILKLTIVYFDEVRKSKKKEKVIKNLK